MIARPSAADRAVTALKAPRRDDAPGAFTAFPAPQNGVLDAMRPAHGGEEPAPQAPRRDDEEAAFRAAHGNRAAAFRALHDGAVPLLLPNAWDFASAAALVDAGFAAIGTTSLGVAAAHGLPDAQGYGRHETLALARLLRRLPCLLTVDLEAGYSGDPGAVAELAAEVASLGAVGINLEDGRPGGVLADPAHQATLVRAVKERVPDLFVNARLDTFWLGGTSVEDTLARAARYVDAGADGVFVPGLTGDGAIATVAAAVPVPLNVLAGRHTLAELADLGVRRVSTGSLLYREALHAAVTTARAIRGDQIRGDQSGGTARSYQRVQDLIAQFQP